MNLLVSVAAEDVKAGDAVVAIDEGVSHTRVVHQVKVTAKQAKVLFLHGEEVTLPVGTQILVHREVATVEKLVEVEETRKRPDLEQAARALERVQGLGLHELDEDYWSVYHGDRDALERYDERLRELGLGGR